jgi:transcriptional regulator with XRE-family HTH domain
VDIVKFFLKNVEGIKKNMKNPVLELLRTKYKLTQKKIGDILGIKNTAVSMYFLGQSKIKYSQLEKIANYLKISISDLIAMSESQFETINKKDLTNNKVWDEITAKYRNSFDLRIIKLTNNSLSPHFQKGDNLIVDTSINEFKTEGYYLININNMEVICKIIISNNGLSFKTNESDYSLMSPIIIGKVKLFLREEE